MFVVWTISVGLVVVAVSCASTDDENFLAGGYGGGPGQSGGGGSDIAGNTDASLENIQKPVNAQFDGSAQTVDGGGSTNDIGAGGAGGGNMDSGLLGQGWAIVEDSSMIFDGSEPFGDGSFGDGSFGDGRFGDGSFGDGNL